jgi:hypothetical protein
VAGTVLSSCVVISIDSASITMYPIVTMCPRSSITTPVPSRLEPRVALLRALGMAFILTRTTAASISSASLSSTASACCDFWACGLSFGS